MRIIRKKIYVDMGLEMWDKGLSTKEIHMTFAAWEKKVRLLNEFVTIHTEVNETGEVVKAWTVNEVWCWDKGLSKRQTRV